MNNVALNLNTAIQSFRQYVPSPVSKISTLGIVTLAALGTCLAAGCYITYKFYQSYRSFCQHADEYQFIRCNILIKQAGELIITDKIEAMRLLEESESLFASLDQKTYKESDKEDFTFKLAIQFAKCGASQKSCTLVNTLTDPKHLLEAVVCLHENDPMFDVSQREKILLKALTIYVDYTFNYNKSKHGLTSPRAKDLDFFLKIATISHKMKLNTDAIFQKASEFLYTPAFSPILRFKGFCTLAVVSNKINIKMSNEFLLKAEEMIENKELPDSSLLAYLTLAKIYVGFQKPLKESKLFNDLCKELMAKDGSPELNSLETLPEYIKIIVNIKNQFPADMRIIELLEAKLNNTLSTVRTAEIEPAKKINILLSLAQGFKSLNNENYIQLSTVYAFLILKNNLVLNHEYYVALKTIVELLNNTSDEFKQAQSLLKQMYFQSSFISTGFNKDYIGCDLILFYNKLKMTEAADEISESYLTDRFNKDTNILDPEIAAINLITLVTSMGFNANQIEKGVKKAESILPSWNLLNRKIVKLLAKLYLKIDYKTSLALMEKVHKTGVRDSFGRWTIKIIFSAILNVIVKHMKDKMHPRTK